MGVNAFLEVGRIDRFEVGSMELNTIISRLARLPKWLLLAGCLLLAFSLGVLDYITGDFSLMMFYLLPIYLASWFIGRGPGLAISLLCGAELFTTNVLHSPGGFSQLGLRAWNSLMEVFFLGFSSYLLSALKSELTLHKKLAFTDPLTGLLNRRSFYELADYELRRTSRYERKLTMVFIDLDNFKAINDTFGHDRGDRVLKTVAVTIREALRSSDVVARFGGDEFAVLLPETGEEAPQALAKLHSRLTKALAHLEGQVTTSIGAVTFRFSPASVEEMINLADRLMYEVKHGGKNQVKHVVRGEDSSSLSRAS